MESGTAKLKWERLNNITSTLDMNSLADESCQVSQQDDPIYFKRVVMSDVALLKIVKHASSNSCKPLLEKLKELKNGRKEMGGLFKGKVLGDALVVMDASVLPLDHHPDFHSKLLDYFDTHLRTGGLDDVVGWYRTSTIGDYPTETDISTQMRIQKLKDPSFALIIDPSSTIDILKVLLHAFRTYPEGYNLFPSHMSHKRDRPDVLLEIYPHLEKRFQLVVTYFKSSSGCDDAWEIYWNHLISTPKTPNKTIGLEVSDNKNNWGVPSPFEKDKVLCHVHVKREFTEQYSSPTEALEGLYVKLVEDVGSSKSESKMSSTQKTSFFAILSHDQANKLADHECAETLRRMHWDLYRILNNGIPYLHYA